VEPTNELVYIVDDEANVGEALSTLLELTECASGSSLRDKTSLIFPAETLVPV
jgi:FixJ family two-component response regulator